ncbi:MAG: V-type ATP synthase subunit F [Oscillospiraceae bacterium]|jgi:V/A-type H+-transporting ATPase subunit F|nr:V-type ATP synthase subunit F [Oscillospiraceae bacterium]
MRFFVIADNSDTLTGFRLAGIDGTRASSPEEIKEAVSKVIANPDIGVLLITEKLARETPELIYDLKLKLTHTLVVEIPDRHGTGRSADSITRYIREAIGIRV